MEGLRSVWLSGGSIISAVGVFDCNIILLYLTFSGSVSSLCYPDGFVVMAN